MDPLKFTTIAHATHRYLSPLSDQKAAWLVDRLAVPPGSRVLDIGCGSATLLLNVITATGAHGVGVDINPAFLERATASAHERGVEDRVEWRCAPLKEAVQADERFDALLASARARRSARSPTRCAGHSRRCAKAALRFSVMATGSARRTPPI